MSIIKNNTSSPFRITFQSSRTPGGAYENVPTTATYGSNAAVVEAIAGIGKIAGAAIESDIAKKEEAKLNKEAKINKLESKQKEKINRSVSEANTSLQQDVKAGLPTSKSDFGLAEIPQPKLSNREKKARGISFQD